MVYAMEEIVKEMVKTNEEVKTNANAKKARTTTKKTNAKPSVSDILKIGNTILTSEKNSKQGIYKRELFLDCKDDKEKKSLRIKLRRKLKNFLGVFLQNEKNPEKISEIKKEWQNYAKQVYNNVEIIMDGNTSNDNAELCKRFLKAMSK